MLLLLLVTVAANYLAQTRIHINFFFTSLRCGHWIGLHHGRVFARVWLLLLVCFTETAAMKAAQSDGDGPVPTRVTEDESTHKEEAVSKPQRLEDAPPAVRDLTYSIFSAVEELDAITTLIDQELSEPYSVYTYRYFIYNWPQLCILCKDAKSSQLVGVIICKADVHKSGKKRGYIAMLVVDKPSRKQGIGAELVARALRTMAELGCDEAVLETELTNKGALRLCVVNQMQP